LGSAAVREEAEAGPEEVVVEEEKRGEEVHEVVAPVSQAQAPVLVRAQVRVQEKDGETGLLAGRSEVVPLVGERLEL
jgi:hypothetical protein